MFFGVINYTQAQYHWLGKLKLNTYPILNIIYMYVFNICDVVLV